MRVLLVKPGVASDSIQPILGLAYLSAQLLDENEVTILDGIKENLSLKQFQKSFISASPDILGIQAFHTDIKTVESYLSIGKKIAPRTITVIGGPYPSLMGESTFKGIPSADFAFQGEAETGFARLLTELKAQGSPLTFHLSPQTLADIPGLIYRAEDGIRANPPVFTQDLDSLGLPAWNLLQPQSYPPAPHGGFFRQFPVAPMNISRGCPCQCSFCSANKISGKNIRYRGIAGVMEEIKLLYQHYQIREIHIVDDNFTWDRGYVLRFCEALQKLNYSLNWTCPNGVRTDTLDQKLLEAMKKAGCYSLSIGIESGSDPVLNYLNKNFSTELIQEKVELIKKSGMEAVGFFLLGLPPEKEEDIKKTIHFSLNLGLRRAQYILFRPFPGSEIYNSLNSSQKENLSKSFGATYADPVFTPEGITVKKLKNLQRWAFLSFYLRPKSFFHLATDISSLKHLYFILKRIKRWLIR